MFCLITELCGELSDVLAQFTEHLLEENKKKSENPSCIDMKGPDKMFLMVS